MARYDILAAVIGIAACYIAAVTVLRVDQMLLSTAVGAIVYIVTQRYYKRS